MKPIFLCIIILGLFCFTCSAETSQNKTKTKSDDIKQIINMEIEDIDMSKIDDGKYAGKVPFREKYLYHVKVTVKSGKIEDIQVVENGTENDYAKKGLGVVERMLEKQSPNVDAVTGATVTSKALMKCVEKALTASQLKE